MTDYYVDYKKGNNKNDGLSPDKPLRDWNYIQLQGGDTVNLHKKYKPNFISRLLQRLFDRWLRVKI